jgi:signal transduction histidine kinase
MADAVELQQVVLNLVLNAVDAVNASVPERRRITLRSLAEDRAGKPWVVVSVEDQGVGIAEEPARLFSAFYTTKPGGMGLGLSICRSIIERHGGTLWAESNIGHGATFHFALRARFHVP